MLSCRVNQFRRAIRPPLPFTKAAWKACSSRPLWRPLRPPRRSTTGRRSGARPALLPADGRAGRGRGSRGSSASAGSAAQYFLGRIDAAAPGFDPDAALDADARPASRAATPARATAATRCRPAAATSARSARRSRRRRRLAAAAERRSGTVRSPSASASRSCPPRRPACRCGSARCAGSAWRGRICGASTAWIELKATSSTRRLLDLADRAEALRPCGCARTGRAISAPRR